ncbi:MAG: glutamate racemase [Anaerolineales bacterium]
MIDSPIGIFDSGVGGLSILREIHRLLPAEDVLYFADQDHVPYGNRTLSQVRSYSTEITRYLLSRGAKLIVVACNTASAAALEHLRQSFSSTPFVGMEPAVKPAANLTQSGHIGVLATPATFEGELFASVVARFASGIQVHQRTVPGLVERIETADLSSRQTRELLRQALEPLIAEDIDTLVLGCTHYPFVVPVIKELVGPGVRVIDPGPAVARQVRRRLDDLDLEAAADRESTITFITTAKSPRLATLASQLIGQPGEMQSASWQAGRLVGPQA